MKLSKHKRTDDSNRSPTGRLASPVWIALLSVYSLVIPVRLAGASSVPFKPETAGASADTLVGAGRVSGPAGVSGLTIGEDFVALLPGRLVLDTSGPIEHSAEAQALLLVSTLFSDDLADSEPAGDPQPPEQQIQNSAATLPTGSTTEPSDSQSGPDSGPTSPAPTIVGPDESTIVDTPGTSTPGTSTPIEPPPSGTDDVPQGSDDETEPTPDPIGLIAPTASGAIRLCFDGSVPPLVRREAMAAANRWDEVLQITGPVVEIDFYWLNFSNPRILGAAGPTRFVVDPSFPEPTARYPIALANELTGIDHAPRDVCDQSGQGEIVMVLNANAGNDAGGWTAGEERVGHAPEPEDATDLQTTMLHELGHGFGFIGSAETNVDDKLAWPNDAESPLVFDLLAMSCQQERPTGCARLDASPVEVGDLEALTGEQLWIRTGLGPLLELEAPTRWDSGSSFSHLDELRYTTDTDYSLMTPYIDTVQRLRRVDNATLAVLQQIGWVLKIPAAPLVSGSVTPGPNQFELIIDPTDLHDGPPPSSYEIRIQRVEADASGELQLSLAYAPFSDTRASATVNGITNGLVYRLDLQGVNGIGPGLSVRTGPVLPQQRQPLVTDAAQIFGTLTGTEPSDAERQSFTSAASDSGLSDALEDLFGARPTSEAVALARLYLGYLDRDPDVAGLLFWLERLDGGIPLEHVVEEFVRSASSESLPGLDNRPFVRSLYTRILDREAEDAGLRFWSSQLDSEMTRGDVLLAISESLEHQDATPVLPGLILAYVRFESRIPTLDETELWYQNINDRGFGDVLSALATNAIPLVQTSAIDG